MSSIFLLSVYLISATELGQLIKIPQFVKHYLEHKAKDTQLSLIGFIEMHYAHEDAKDADYDEDMKLPFKNHNICSGISAFSFLTGNLVSLTFQLPDTEKKIYSPYRDQFLPSISLSSIWQPPRDFQVF